MVILWFVIGTKVRIVVAAILRWILWGSHLGGVFLPKKNLTLRVVNRVLKEAFLQEIATKISAIMEPTLRRVVKEEVESLVFNLQSSPRCSLVHQPEPSALRVLQLVFAKSLPSTLFTNSSIKDEEHASLQISLLDGRSKSVIQHGPFSSIKVEVLVLKADFAANGQEDWSESEFSNGIVREREGKRPLLVGELSLSLVNGVGFIGNIFFTDNSSWVRSRKFRLGIRAVSSASGGTAIREAVSEAFVVLDHRGESYQKRATPFLDDPVWRLKKISKMGASHKKLESHGIMTVKDFLMQYHMNPLFLRRVLGNGVPNRAWETIVKHANECHLDNTHYSYYNAAERAELLFNCVYKVISVKFEGHDFQPLGALDYHQKALVDKLKQCAFNQNELVPVHSLSAITPILSSTIQQNVAFTGANLELQEDGDCPSIIDQDEPERQLDFNLSESASYPCTIEDGYIPEDDSTAQSNQPMHGFSPAAFLMSDSTSADPEPEPGIYSWFQYGPFSTIGSNTEFGEPCHPQTALLYPFATTWEQDNGNGLLTTVTPASHTGVNISGTGTGKSKAGWCKIRAAVMWKIVRRDAAARRKAMFAFRHC